MLFKLLSLSIMLASSVVLLTNISYLRWDFKYVITKNKLNSYIFFWIRGNPTLQKAHFVDPDERVKPRLSQTLTRGARPDSNSRPAVQISNPLPSRYAHWGHTYMRTCMYLFIHVCMHGPIKFHTTWHIIRSKL